MPGIPPKPAKKTSGKAKQDEENDDLPNPPVVTDWSQYKQGEKKASFWFELKNDNYYEYSLPLDLQKDVHIDSIVLGFHGISHNGGEKTLCIPSSILIEAGKNVFSLKHVCAS